MTGKGKAGAALAMYLARAVELYGRSEIPTYEEIGKACGVHLNVVARVARGDRTLNLRLAWQIIEFLRQRGFDATIASLITWPLPEGGPVLERAFAPGVPTDEEPHPPPRLHMRLAELAELARFSDTGEVEALFPRTGALAEAAGVDRRTVQRWYKDDRTYADFASLLGLARAIIAAGFPIHPEDLLAYPAGGEAIMALETPYQVQGRQIVYRPIPRLGRRPAREQADDGPGETP
jgi:transcriptional regulator with XRE-family HTH domain